MENNAGRKPGPRPALEPTGPTLSGRRAELLETLRAQALPTGLAALAALTGLHENTLREHVRALLADGLVTRRPGPVSGRGRPAWLYAAAAVPVQTQSEYAPLAVALAGVIARTSPEPAQEARTAGLDWGRRLAATRRTRGPGERAARDAVVGLFDQMGFAPRPDGQANLVRLTRCPLLEAAHQETEVVCAVHQGIAEGALAAYGADADAVSLLPFAEPGACRMHLGNRP